MNSEKKDSRKNEEEEVERLKNNSLEPREYAEHIHL